MNEVAAQAQINALIEQRNAALNTVVNLMGELAVSKHMIDELTQQLEGATTLFTELHPVETPV
jgi:hypothetical protein